MQKFKTKVLTKQNIFSIIYSELRKQTNGGKQNMNRKEIMKAVESIMNIAFAMYEGEKIVNNYITVCKAVVDYRKKNKEQMFFSITEKTNVTGTYVGLAINGKEIVNLYRIPNNSNISDKAIYFENKILENAGL